MLEFVLLGAAALWFVLWSRQQEPKEEEKEEMLPVTVPVAFIGTNRPFWSPPSQKSIEPLHPAKV